MTVAHNISSSQDLAQTPFRISPVWSAVVPWPSQSELSIYSCSPSSYIVQFLLQCSATIRTNILSSLKLDIKVLFLVPTQSSLDTNKAVSQQRKNSFSPSKEKTILVLGHTVKVYTKVQHSNHTQSYVVKPQDYSQFQSKPAHNCYIRRADTKSSSISSC